MNFGEHIAGRSILGTRKPSPGRSSSGSAISAFIPHTIVVSPNLTRADPSAVVIDPTDGLQTSAVQELEYITYRHTNVNANVSPVIVLSAIRAKALCDKSL